MDQEELVDRFGVVERVVLVVVLVAIPVMDLDRVAPVVVVEAAAALASILVTAQGHKAPVG
jgi:hypothetical protein